MAKTVRNSNVEMLRVAIMFGILLWHVTVHGFGLAHLEGSERIDHELANSVCVALFAPCVNLFVLISGYYGMKFKAKTLLRFDAQAVFYSLSVAAAMYFIFHDASLKILLKAVFPIVFSRWWFLNAYVMLLILSPIINEGVSRLTKRQHLWIIILFFVLNGVFYLLRLEGNGYNLQSFIHVYVIGQFLCRYREGYKAFSSRRLALAGLCLCVAINLTAMCACMEMSRYYPKLLTRGVTHYLSYSNPVIVFQSVFILCAVLSFAPRSNGRVNAVARNVFAVYLVTEAVGMRLYVALKDIFVDNFAAGVAVSLLVFFACIAVEVARSAAYDWIIARAESLKALHCRFKSSKSIV